MTKKLEEFFNLPKSTPEVEVIPVVEEVKNTPLMPSPELYSALTTAEKIDAALPMVTGLEEHDQSMDDIAEKAQRTFNDLISLGSNVPDVHAGKIYEVAGQMLKTALDAKNSKAERKLKMIELQLKRVRAEQIDFEMGQGPSKANGGGEFDRNELLKHIANSTSPRKDGN